MQSNYAQMILDESKAKAVAVITYIDDSNFHWSWALEKKETWKLFPVLIGLLFTAASSLSKILLTASDTFAGEPPTSNRPMS